jgi:hypothetical protein
LSIGRSTPLPQHAWIDRVALKENRPIDQHRLDEGFHNLPRQGQNKGLHSRFSKEFAISGHLRGSWVLFLSFFDC